MSPDSVAQANTLRVDQGEAGDEHAARQSDELPIIDMQMRSSRARVAAFATHRPALVSAIFLGGIIALAFSAPLWLSGDGLDQDLQSRLAGPSLDHLLGTDHLGRDVFERVVIGARVSFMAAFESVALAALIGIPAGLISGSAPRWLDIILSRLADSLLSVPAILMAMAVVAALGPGIHNAMLALSIIMAPRLFRVTRGSVIAQAGAGYIDSAKIGGCSPLRILFTHVLPNIRQPLTVQVSLLLGFAILAEASLSYLGMGVIPPDSSWGLMLRGAMAYTHQAPLLAVAPGVAVFTVTLAFNYLGDGLQDAMGPVVARKPRTTKGRRGKR